MKGDNKTGGRASLRGTGGLNTHVARDRAPRRDVRDLRLGCGCLHGAAGTGPIRRRGGSSWVRCAAFRASPGEKAQQPGLLAGQLAKLETRDSPLCRSGPAAMPPSRRRGTLWRHISRETGIDRRFRMPAVRPTSPGRTCALRGPKRARGTASDRNVSNPIER